MKRCFWPGTEANRERKYEQGDDYGSKHTGRDTYGGRHTGDDDYGNKRTGGVASHVPGEHSLLFMYSLTHLAHNS